MNMLRKNNDGSIEISDIDNIEMNMRNNKEQQIKTQSNTKIDIKTVHEISTKRQIRYKSIYLTSYQINTNSASEGITQCNQFEVASSDICV